MQKNIRKSGQISKESGKIKKIRKARGYTIGECPEESEIIPGYSGESGKIQENPRECKRIRKNLKESVKIRENPTESGKNEKNRKIATNAKKPMNRKNLSESEIIRNEFECGRMQKNMKRTLKNNREHERILLNSERIREKLEEHERIRENLIENRQNR
mgnify:CR=1 FL=1